jgi:prepilin peptidase dependent protein B
VQDIDLQSFCATPCPSGSASCPPHQQVRSLALVITGRLSADASVTRSVRSNVRLRNDPVIGACAV